MEDMDSSGLVGGVILLMKSRKDLEGGYIDVFRGKYHLKDNWITKIQMIIRKIDHFLYNVIVYPFLWTITLIKRIKRINDK